MLLFGNFVLLFTSPLLFLIVLLFTAVWKPVNGRPQVISSSQPIVAALGDDVILPCHLEPQLSVEQLTVEWWRPDLPPDPADPLSQYKYVHRYHDNHDAEDRKMSAYAGRTALLAGGLKHGNISLKIMNVKLSDQGRYRCFIPQLWTASIIKLVVVFFTATPPLLQSVQTANQNEETTFKDNSTCHLCLSGQFNRNRLIPVVVFCSIFLILLAGVCVNFHIKRCKKKHISQPPPHEPPPV